MLICYSVKTVGEEHSFLQFFVKPFLLGQKLVQFSRELNEILRPVGYKSDHTIIMILLSLYVCDVAVLGNSRMLKNLITVSDILHEQEKMYFFQN